MMKDNTLIVDWLSDVVEPWFNSQNKEGGFITTVTKYNLFNNLQNIGVITIYADNAFQRPPIRTEVRRWFRNKLKELNKVIEKNHPTSRVLLINGCTPQQEITGVSGERFKAFVMKQQSLYMNDNDALLRLAGRFKSRFINESPTILFPEPFFNLYMNELWGHCSRYLQEHKNNGILALSSNCLTTRQMQEVVQGYFSGTVLPIEEHRDEDDAGLVSLQDSASWFDRSFNEAGIEQPPALEWVRAQALLKAEEEFKDNDLVKAI